MEIFRFNILPLKELIKKEWLHAQGHCSKCNSELRFNHEIIMAGEDYIQEVAHCPACQTKVREDLFKLQ